jgi:hypothetical protein
MIREQDGPIIVSPTSKGGGPPRVIVIRGLGCLSRGVLNLGLGASSPYGGKQWKAKKTY